MTQVLSVVDRKVAYMEKSRKFYKKLWKFVEINKLTLNTNKTKLIFFSRDNSDFGSIFYKNEFLTTQKSCRYLGIQIDRNLSFEEQLNKTLKKMAHAIRSIYLIRHQLPLNAQILLQKSNVFSHLPFSAILFQNLSAINLKRLNRQINWGIKVCFLRKKYDKARDLLIQTKTLPAELIIAKISLIKFCYDIARPENSEKFHGYLSLHQNTRTKQFKIRQNAKTSFGMNSIVRQCVQKWNKLPHWLRLAKNENVIKKTLNDFLLSHEKIPLNSNIGAFKSYFYF